MLLNPVEEVLLSFCSEVAHLTERRLHDAENCGVRSCCESLGVAFAGGPGVTQLTNRRKSFISDASGHVVRVGLIDAVRNRG